MEPHKTEGSSVLTDAQIIALYWARQESAIQETDSKYGEFLFRIAYNILSDKSDSEECQNDTYLGVWNTIPPTRPDVFPAFLTKIMHNIAVDKYREKCRGKRIPSQMTVALEELEYALSRGHTPEENLQSEALGAAINGYLATLSVRQRYIFVGRFYMGDKLETIAGELGLSASTVHRQIQKLRRGLKGHLEKEGIYV